MAPIWFRDGSPVLQICSITKKFLAIRTSSHGFQAIIWQILRSPLARHLHPKATGKGFFLWRTRNPFPKFISSYIRALLARRHGSVKPNEASIPEGSECEIGLDKNFGFSKQFVSHYEMGEEVGRGHFGYTCSAKGKKGSMKGQEVAVKGIPKSKMTTAIAIEDVRREVNILRALTGHKNLVQFYDAFEDDEHVYIAMELYTGGELLDSILQRGGKYSEDEAKAVMVQILSVAADNIHFMHILGV